jgi:hypothetical protein
MPTNKQRVTINLSDSEYSELANLAEHNNVSMAWIGHKALIEFLEQTHRENLQLQLPFPQRPERHPLARTGTSYTTPSSFAPAAKEEPL